jgi:hypothetical protein
MISNSRSPILAGLGFGALIGVGVWYFRGGELWLRVGSSMLAMTLLGVIVKALRTFSV